MLPNGSKSVISLICFLHSLGLLYLYNRGNFEQLMWDFANIDNDTGKKLEEIDAKLYTDEIYRTREKERDLQEILGRFKTSN
jgi:hypothetical protein